MVAAAGRMAAVLPEALTSVRSRFGHQRMRAHADDARPDTAFLTGLRSARTNARHAQANRQNCRMWRGFASAKAMLEHDQQIVEAHQVGDRIECSVMFGQPGELFANPKLPFHRYFDLNSTAEAVRPKDSR